MRARPGLCMTVRQPLGSSAPGTRGRHRSGRRKGAHGLVSAQEGVGGPGCEMRDLASARG